MDHLEEEATRRFLSATSEAEWQLGLLTAIISGLQVICYITLINGGSKWARCISWEVIFVVAVECMGYSLVAILRASGIDPNTPLTSGIDPVTGEPGGRFINFFRMGSWFITCPVLLYFIVRVVHPSPTNRQIIQFTMLLQAVFVSGVACALAETAGTRAFLCSLGLGALVMLFGLIHGAYIEHRDELPKEILYVLVHLYASWCMFPFFFILGDEYTGSFSRATTNCGYAVGDLFAKNLFSCSCVWYLSIYLEQRDRKQALNSMEMSALQKSAVMDQRQFQDEMVMVVEKLSEEQARLADILTEQAHANDYATKMLRELATMGVNNMGNNGGGGNNNMGNMTPQKQGNNQGYTSARYNERGGDNCEPKRLAQAKEGNQESNMLVC